MTDHIIFLLTLIFTVIYTSAALFAIIVGYRQVRGSFDISTREKSLDAYLNFSEKYAELTRLSHEIDVRFHPDFIAFIREMEAIPYDPGLPNAAFAPLEALVRTCKKESGYWKL